MNVERTVQVLRLAELIYNSNLHVIGELVHLSE